MVSTYKAYMDKIPPIMAQGMVRICRVVNAEDEDMLKKKALIVEGMMCVYRR
jgi:hypothetical protein